MSRVCANCASKEGPFNSIHLYYFPPIWVCKNTKSAQDRVAECVKRRDKIDYDKYKEQMNLL